MAAGRWWSSPKSQAWRAAPSPLKPSSNSNNAVSRMAKSSASSSRPVLCLLLWIAWNDMASRSPTATFCRLLWERREERYELTSHKHFFVLSCCLIDRYSFYVAHGGAGYTPGAHQKTFDDSW